MPPIVLVPVVGMLNGLCIVAIVNNQVTIQIQIQIENEMNKYK